MHALTSGRTTIWTEQSVKPVLLPVLRASVLSTTSAIRAPLGPLCTQTARSRIQSTARLTAELRPTLTQLSAGTALRTARPAPEVEPPIVLFVCLGSSLSLQPMNVSAAAQLHTSPTQPLAPVISVTPRAPPALLQRPTARPARLSTTPLQPPSLEPALSVMQPVMNAQAQATQPVKPAIRPITQWTSILPPA